MAHAYTPGLRVTGNTVLRKQRRLPLPGKVHVKVGDLVSATDIIASTELPGSVTTVNVAREMNCQPNEVPGYMVKEIGERVENGEIMAESKSFWGLFHSFVKAPVPGVLESVSNITGQVLLRGKPTPVQLEAYLDGRVVEVLGDEAVTVEARCALLQGIFGLGGETYGEIKLLVSKPDEPLAVDRVDESCRGKVLVAGAFASLAALQQAIRMGAAAVVVGGVRDHDVDELLGYHLGVAVTGSEKLGLTLVVTEGFGSIPMAHRAFELLRSREGSRASVSGATQIRAGVIRPEVIISVPEETAAQVPSEEQAGLLNIGSPIRLIREPYFGLLATVAALPEEPQKIETEASVRVLAAKLEDGQVVTVPRANVELIEQ
ncbi:MAG: hypothetical protein LLG01_03505 [Planctomycetaceae bacterium]|nr:hypothetical protein [Planctomycetaceae bacterium]